MREWICQTGRFVKQAEKRLYSKAVPFAVVANTRHLKSCGLESYLHLLLACETDGLKARLVTHSIVRSARSDVNVSRMDGRRM